GLGEPGGEVVDRVLADRRRLSVEAGDLVCRLPVAGGAGCAPRALAVETSELLQPALQGLRVVDDGDHLLGCRQPADADVDADDRGRLGDARLLGPGGGDLPRGDDPRPSARDRDREDARPPTRHEAFDLASVLVRADRPEPREREVTPVVFQAHGPGRERAAVPVLAALFVAGKADPTAGDRARKRALPAPV